MSLGQLTRYTGGRCPVAGDAHDSTLDLSNARTAPATGPGRIARADRLGLCRTPGPVFRLSGGNPPGPAGRSLARSTDTDSQLPGCGSRAGQAGDRQPWLQAFRGANRNRHGEARPGYGKHLPGAHSPRPGRTSQVSDPGSAGRGRHGSRLQGGAPADAANGRPQGHPPADRQQARRSNASCKRSRRWPG